ncbi:sorting nexin-19a [Osmerus eperlanus]|uniref:sorting nexin-19a n=1 Tax=Osmerus eperlanus TaxID=29151 RepID=UPI002E0F4601
MPPPDAPGSHHWPLSELLGQRRLLGFTILLAWLVLFHLLVNVWLLCIFTSLLVVLGGWLGIRAALDANSLLHLEHFVPMGRLQSALHSPESEWRLDHEIHNAVHKAVRDFVSSWYRTLVFEEGGEFEQEVQDAMLESVMELKERALRVDRKALVQKALELCGCHLQSYMTARETQAEANKLQRERSSLWELYSKADAPHPALSSPATELSYARAVVNLLLHVLVPSPHLETRTGRYMVGELVTCNVLLPLVSRVSDPDWLNLTIVEIFTKSRERPGQEELSGTLYKSQTRHESWATCCSDSTTLDEQDTPSKSHFDLAGVSYDANPHESFYMSQGLKEEALQDSMVSLVSSGKGDSCSAGLLSPCQANCFYQQTDSDQESHLLDSKKHSFDSLLRMDSEEDQADSYCECTSSTNFCSVLGFEDDLSGCFGPLRALGTRVTVPEEPHWPAGMAEDLPAVCAAGGLGLTPFSFEPPISLDGPATIQNLRISGTVTAKEHRGTGNHPYTLYTVKYETLVDAECLGALQPVAYHTVNRRYSEFLNLQTRLEVKPDLRKMIKSKDIKGPKKLFPDLSFGNADLEKVEVRKSQLDTFLKQLSTIPETANSEEMQEFLALNTDASTAFEKKPFVMSRLDKMVGNALDTLKTAFPRSDPLSPSDDLDGDSSSESRVPPDSRKPRSRLRFSSKIAPSLNIPDLQPKVTYSFSEDSTVFNGLSLSGLESFVGEQERLLSWPPGAAPGEARRASQPPGADRRGGGSWERKPRGTDTAVADVALNILCLLMRNQWSWLCTENIQKTIRLLFGTFIERWLDVGVAHLTSAPCWVIYLQVMQEAVWPGGTLPAQPRSDRSPAQREETKQQCLNCLLQLLPEFITDMLGTEKYRQSLETVLDSLQDSHINKHLVYCVCDLLLEFLIPESSEEDFQRSLLHSLSGDVERVSASA